MRHITRATRNSWYSMGSWVSGRGYASFYQIDQGSSCRLWEDGVHAGGVIVDAQVGEEFAGNAREGRAPIKDLGCTSREEAYWNVRPPVLACLGDGRWLQGRNTHGLSARAIYQALVAAGRCIPLDGHGHGQVVADRERSHAHPRLKQSRIICL